MAVKELVAVLVEVRRRPVQSGAVASVFLGLLLLVDQHSPAALVPDPIFLGLTKDPVAVGVAVRRFGRAVEKTVPQPVEVGLVRVFPQAPIAPRRDQGAVTPAALVRLGRDSRVQFPRPIERP